MLQSVSSVFVVYRPKTLTGSPDPTHANGTDKPCKIKFFHQVGGAVNDPFPQLLPVNDPVSDLLPVDDPVRKF